MLRHANKNDVSNRKWLDSVGPHSCLYHSVRIRRVETERHSWSLAGVRIHDKTWAPASDPDTLTIWLRGLDPSDGSVVCVTYEAGAIQFEEFPKTKEPAWILGVGYNTVSDRQELQNDISSRLWFTYRKNFTPIGGTGPMSDQGWGCMLRCGQMMLGQALVCRHLGRDWRWNSAAYDNDYTKILQLFLDKKDSCYSIHQIAQMGVSEGKSVGQWFGPNTVAQVLKKLALFEDWSSLAIHVAMDNTVIIDDIKKLCRSARQPTASQVTNSFLCNGVSSEQQTTARSRSPLPWQPLMLIIPLRLGLSELNPVYVDCLKACFTLRQTLGMIGGKPNHAHYFIGYVGNSLVYLDPHTTQPAVELLFCCYSHLCVYIYIYR
ncbi:Cysteine protease atg4a [Branchiostoma belcheri]|nr:Cysteine protease atg4a [Branchiostoma belcheri]